MKMSLYNLNKLSRRWDDAFCIAPEMKQKCSYLFHPQWSNASFHSFDGDSADDLGLALDKVLASIPQLQTGGNAADDLAVVAGGRRRYARYSYMY